MDIKSLKSYLKQQLSYYENSVDSVKKDMFLVEDERIECLTRLDQERRTNKAILTLIGT